LHFLVRTYPQLMNFDEIYLNSLNQANLNNVVNAIQRVDNLPLTQLGLQLDLTWVEFAYWVHRFLLCGVNSVRSHPYSLPAIRFPNRYYEMWAVTIVDYWRDNASACMRAGLRLPKVEPMNGGVRLTFPNN
jgi:hypothetical protein